jgi:hypothetical protein
MTIREIELMRRLQREYYDNLRGVHGAGRLVRCPHSSRVMLFYRLCVTFVFAWIVALVIHKF